MVDARLVAVRPGDLKRVAADDLDESGSDVLADVAALDLAAAGELVQAMGARAEKPHFPEGEGEAFAGVPLDEHLGAAVWVDADWRDCYGGHPPETVSRLGEGCPCFS